MREYVNNVIRHRIRVPAFDSADFADTKKPGPGFYPAGFIKTTLTKWGYVKGNLEFSDISDNKNSYKLLRLRFFPAENPRGE